MRTPYCSVVLYLSALGWLIPGLTFGAGDLRDEGDQAKQRVADEKPLGSKELLHQPNLASTAGDAPGKAWEPWHPEWAPARFTIQPKPNGAHFSAPDAPFAVGGLSQTVEGIKGGQAYAISARCELAGISHPYAAVLVRLTWLQGDRALHPAGILVRGPRVTPQGVHFDDVLIAPAEANRAQLSLEAKWPRGGTVLWKSASLRHSNPPAPRKVKVGTVYLRPRNSTPERNLDLWCEQLDRAGKLGLDVVCLSEAILLVGTSAKTSDVAESIPGPSTQRLGDAARRNGLWVVAGLMERDGRDLFNTAVLLDREGNLAGTYRKVHLPREEWKKGITPGEDYPVFETDFGTVAIQICYDYFFPETAQILALRGAEIVFAPTWGTTFADRDGRAEGQTLFRARARDNGIYLVPSVYDGDSLVIDPLGRILASSQGRTGVFWAEVDLSHREPLWWVGEWRSLGPRHRRPETYDPSR